MSDLYIPVAVVFSCGVAFANDSSGGTVNDLTSQSEDFRKQSKLSEPRPVDKPIIVTQEESEAAPQSDEGPKFLVREILLEGNHIYSNNELLPYLTSNLNQNLSVSDLKRVAMSITTHYRSHGFSTSRAYVPPQKIENGIAAIKIVEAKVGKIIVEGNRLFPSSSYEEALHFRSDRAFNYNDLEKSLYELNQSPMRKAKAYILPGVEPLTSDIVLKTQEQNPLYVFYDFNNRGTKLTHRARNGAGFVHSNITHHEDTLAINASFAEENAFDGGSLYYSFPLKKTGTTLSLQTSYSETLAVKHFKPLNIEGESLALVPEISQEILRKPNYKLDASIAFEYKDSKTTINKIKSSLDRMRVVNAGLRMQFMDNGGQTSVASNIHRGIPNIIGGLKENDSDASRTNSGGDFTYYTGNISRVQKLPWSSFLTLKAGGQWTADTLTSLETYRLGGAFSVRGYPEANSFGDYGYEFSSELSIPASFVPEKMNVVFTNKKIRDTLRVVGFLDGGQVFLRERELPADEKSKFLLGAGFGIRLDLGRACYLQADMGWPIGDDSSDENQRQVHLWLRSGF